jgi:hypothetical protein
VHSERKQCDVFKGVSYFTVFSYSFMQKPRKTGDDEESEDLDLEDEEILDEGEEEEEEGSGTGNT